MFLPLTRWFTATLNLLLTALASLYLFIMAQNAPNNLTHDLSGWLVLVALCATTVASGGASICLAWRRTLPIGITWNSIVGFCLGMLVVGGSLETIVHSGVRWTDFMGYALAVAIVAVWPLLSLSLRRLLQRETTVSLSAEEAVHSVPIASTLDAAVAVSSRKILQEKAPVVLRPHI